MYWIDELLALFRVEPNVRQNVQLLASLAVVLLPLPIVFAFMRWSRPRQSVVPPYRERVLILGASSGVGREIALQYARRGCRNIAIVGRRLDQLRKTAEDCAEAKKQGEEWEQSDEAPGWNKQDKRQAEHGGVIIIQADCSNVDDVLRVRQSCKDAFDGLDTIHICFGVSALRPLLGIAGVDPIRPMKRAEILPDLPKQTSMREADRSGLLITQKAARQIHEVNVVGTSIILSAFLPMLQTTSHAPSIHLLSSSAAVIPPPTRSLYAASKASQLMLFQATAVEAAVQAKRGATLSPRRQHVYFYACMPGTIKSDFRSSAVDMNPQTDDAAIVAPDSSHNSKSGADSDVLLPADVAERVILATDQYKQGIDEVPFKYWLARRLVPYTPSFLASQASKKYQYI